MLLWLFEHLAGYNNTFQVVRYLSLRALLSVLTALAIGWALGPVMIRKLQALKYGQAVSSFAPENHAKKMGTPTMGGILILLSIGISTLLWADLSNPYVWIVLAVMIIFGAVGWADDWIKVRYKDNAGLPAKKKFFWTSVGSIGAGIALYVIAIQQPNPEHTANMLDLLIPFFKDLSIPLSSVPLGIGFIIFTYLVIKGASNAVNLTDGLDGLAAGSCAITSVAYVVIALALGYVHFTLFPAAVTGACLGFLFYNQHPAKMFMGDTGSLALGGAVLFLIIATISKSVEPKKIIKDAPWQVVWFSIGFYIVVYGLKNAGLTDYLTVILRNLTLEGDTIAVIGTGFIAAFLSAIMNNMPTIMIMDIALRDIGNQAMIYANIVGCNLGPKMTPFGSLATLLWLHVLAKKGVKISFAQYSKFGLIITPPVLFIVLLAI